MATVSAMCELLLVKAEKRDIFLRMAFLSSQSKERARLRREDE